MFKILFVSFMITCLVIPASAQTIEEREVGEFNKISLRGSLTAKIVQGDKNTVHIESQELPLDEISIENDNKELKIKAKPDLLSDHNGDKLLLLITHKEKIESLTALADAKVSFDKPLIRKDFQLNTGSGAHVILEINAEKLNVKAYQGGQVQIKGETVHLDAYINSGGILSGIDLVCQAADVKLNTGAKGEITVKKEINAKVSTGADFSYLGNPEKKNTKTLLGGNISAWDEEKREKAPEDKNEEENKEGGDEGTDEEIKEK